MYCLRNKEEPGLKRCSEVSAARSKRTKRSEIHCRCMEKKNTFTSASDPLPLRPPELREKGNT